MRQLLKACHDGGNSHAEQRANDPSLGARLITGSYIRLDGPATLPTLRTC